MSAMDDEGHSLCANSANKKLGDVVEGLRDALANRDDRHEPWTSGVVDLSDTEKTLYYQRQDGTSNSLKLGSVDAAEAEDLSHACSPATFGRNNQDVLDETYRKAGKLDAGKFGWLFNPSNHGNFLSNLVSGLFPWCSLNKGIRFELYKLNVYEKGSFFKAHQDTPRSGDMFGSLVILLPIAHKGGNLRLVHGGRKVVFDGQALLKKSTATSVAYVAFFSDIEHEVTRVTSGHRVTITFNLYFDSRISPPITLKSTTEHPFKTALRKILKSSAIRKAPGCLGFGLEHAYPFERTIMNPDSIELKGLDAVLIQTLAELKILYAFFLLYRGDEEDCPFRILSPAIIDGDDGEYGYPALVTMPDSILVWDRDPKDVEKDPPSCSSWYDAFRDGFKRNERFKSMNVEWVTEPGQNALDRSATIAFGNDASLEYHYHQLCVVASLRPNEFAYMKGHKTDSRHEFWHYRSAGIPMREMLHTLPLESLQFLWNNFANGHRF